MFNMTMVKEHVRLATAKFSGTDFNVLHFLLGIVDHEGISVATIEQIANGTDRSISGVTLSVKRLQDAGKVKRVGRSGFEIAPDVLRPHRWGYDPDGI